jgi:hypothetical protein
MAEKYVLAFLWWVILGASESYVAFKAQHMLLYLPINLQINSSLAI